MISEFTKLISQIDPGAGGTILGVFLGYWLSTASVTRSTRRGHRKILREIRSEIISRPWHAVSGRDRIKDWWVTAIEDYSLIRKFRISLIIDALHKIELPCPHGFHIDDESGGTSDQRQAYCDEMDKMVEEFRRRIDSVIRWA